MVGINNKYKDRSRGIFEKLHFKRVKAKRVVTHPSYPGLDNIYIIVIFAL